MSEPIDEKVGATPHYRITGDHWGRGDAEECPLKSNILANSKADFREEIQEPGRIYF